MWSIFTYRSVNNTRTANTWSGHISSIQSSSHHQDTVTITRITIPITRTQSPSPGYNHHHQDTISVTDRTEYQNMTERSAHKVISPRQLPLASVRCGTFLPVIIKSPSSSSPPPPFVSSSRLLPANCPQALLGFVCRQKAPIVLVITGRGSVEFLSIGAA